MVTANRCEYRSSVAPIRLGLALILLLSRYFIPVDQAFSL